ncbi:VHS-domain-containing protein [Microthyrium microscopicum]|uniref:VHS-domain-containing protein n=1 Tax=Microthyrium microscopicum TaxID=703497 RepID=A0A6A6U423_9PEZI|nr:VHS-domain-containing protein [Microthyrium microscopicum]
MATRDRFGGFSEPVANSPLQRYIMNACDPQNFEPNLALNLEIADLINAKKGNSPREAAVTIVNYVNHRNANVSLLALNLLDICVKNCGYPFQLQVSTKEFLNEFVRRFPERPPVHPSRVQNKILGLIEEWRSTICQTSRYKEDLGFIRDMHRLLSYKGYIFPEVTREDAAVLNSSDNLRSADEMEEEEREAQSAKLQELIRRGGPQDLQEANKLMKVMAGYDTRNKTNWRAKAAEEVGKIQQKAKLLEDMLQRHQAGDQLTEGDVFEELSNSLISAHPKIQKMCEEESEDHEAVAKLLEINDSIHRTIERYKLIKKGDVEAANRIPKGTLGTSGAGVTKGPNNELSLIDLGGPDDEAFQSAPSASSGAPTSTGNALEDDLLGLSLDAPSDPVGGSISLPITSGASSSFGMPQSQTNHMSNAQITSLFGQPQQSQPPVFSPPPQLLFDTPSSPQLVQQHAPAPAPVVPKPDPFAIITSSQGSRTASPFQFQQSTKPPSVLAAKSPQIPQSTAPSSAAPAAADDEWEFASAVPSVAPSALTLTSGAITIAWEMSRPAGQQGMIEIKSKVSNNTPNPISDLTFQVAVTKAYSLKLEPQSSLNLAPSQKEGITQMIRLIGVQPGQGSTVRMRWKVGYSLGGQRKEDTGGVDGLPASI